MLQKFYKPFLIFCAIGAFSFQVYFFANEGFSFNLRLPIFLILLLLNSHYQIISLDNRSSFSINFPLLFPIMIWFGPAWASLMASLGLISSDEFELDRSVFLFNRGSLGLAAGFGTLAFVSTGGQENLALAIIASVAAYSLVNHTLFVIACYLRREPEIPWGSLTVDTLKTLLPSAALSWLFYIAFLYFDVLGLISAFFVFITFRSGALLGHLESRYRVSLIKALLRAVYAKDPDLMAHLENVAYYSKRLAKACHYPFWKLNAFDEASYFHDIGKLEISDSILKKEGKLTPDEFEEMRFHPSRGIEFLQEIPLPAAQKRLVENITGSHHERYDGLGYPDQLKGEEIPLEARIVAVADTWDAMVGKRCYRKPVSIPEAIAELRRVKGTQLDSHLVELFIELVENDLKNGKQTAKIDIPLIPATS